MPSNSNLILDLLGSFIGQSTPKLRQGAYTIGPDGQVIAPYEDPGWGTKFFHPNVASYEADANNAALTQQAKAEAQNRITNLIAGQNFGKVKPYQGTPLSDENLPDDVGGLLTGGNETAQNLLGANEAQAKMAKGIPLSDADVAAQGNVNTLAELKSSLPNVQPRQNLIGNQISAAQTLLPGQTALEGQRNALGLQYDPLRFASEGASNEASMLGSNRLIGNASTMDNIVKQQALNELLDARTQGVVSQKKNDLSGLIATTLANNLGKEAFGSSQMPMSSDPRVASIKDGVITPGVSNPLFTPSIATKIEGMGNGAKTTPTLPGGGTINIKGGLPMVRPQYNTSGELIGGNGVNTAPLSKQSPTVTQSLPVTSPDFNNFIETMKQGKSGSGRGQNKKDPNDAMQSLAEQIASKRKTGRSHVGADTYYNAMLGKDPNMHWSEIIDMLHQFKPEEQNEMYQKALKAGGY